MEGEAASITKAIECPAAGITAGRAMIVALIEIATGFLSRGQRNLHLLAIFVDHDRRWRFLARPGLRDREAFEFAHLAIISENDRAWAIAFLQNSCEQRLQSVDCLGETLNDEIFSITIDNEARQEVSLGMNPAAQKRIDTQAGPKVVGLVKTPAEEPFVDLRIHVGVGASEKTQCDLRLRTVEGLADGKAALIAHANNGARLGVFRIENVAAINPEVSVADAGGPALSNADIAVWPCFT